MVELTIAVLAVILISATCSLMEAVLYSVPLSHIESLVQAKQATGITLQKLREKVDEPIAAILSLNTIANTAGAAIAGALAANVFGSNWVALFSAFLTMAILFFSEVVPKTFGVVYARPLSEWIARPLVLLVWIFRPLIWLLGLATRTIAGSSQKEQMSEAELVVMTQMGIRTGVINEDEGKVIKNILSLEDKIVREVMTPRTVLFALQDDMLVEEASQEKRIFSHSRIPVYVENIEDITGIVHRHDIFVALAKDQTHIRLSELAQPAHFIFERATLDEVLKKFLDLRRHMFIVIGEFGDLAGVITLEDVLEEILGREIVDESDRVADMRKLAEMRRKRLLRETTNVYRHNKGTDNNPPA